VLGVCDAGGQVRQGVEPCPEIVSEPLFRRVTGIGEDLLKVGQEYLAMEAQKSSPDVVAGHDG
jgi:hypothetical protein